MPAGILSAVITGGGYTRPTDWLPLAMPTEESIVGLLAVVESGGTLDLSFQTGVTVDWGDGSAPQHVNALTQTSHAYDWADLAPSTLTSRGYRQAILTITPDVEIIDAWFQNFTGGARFLDLAIRAPALTALTLPAAGWMERLRVGPNELVTLEGLGGSALRELELETVDSVTGLLSTASGMTFTEIPQALIGIFPNLLTQTQGLANAGWRNVTASFPLMTSLSGMFYACPALSTVRIPDAGMCTNFSGMFNQCPSLEIVAVDTSAGTDFSSMFNGCYVLQSVDIDTSLAVNCDSMFNGCPIDVSNLDFGSVETMKYFMSGGGTSGPVTVDAPNCTNYGGAFSYGRATSITLNASSADTSDIQDAYEGTFAGAFGGANELASITLIGSTQVFTGPKVGCEGTALTHAALVYIINHLQDRSVGFTFDAGQGPGVGVLGVGSPGVAALTIAEIAVATARNWVVFDEIAQLPVTGI